MKFGNIKSTHAIVGNIPSPECLKILKSLDTELEFHENCSDEDSLKAAEYFIGKCNTNSLIRKFGVMAARNGHLETLIYILRQEKNWDIQDYMAAAIEMGKKNIVMYLFENYSKYITTKELNAALYTAVKHDQLGIVKYLGDKGADFNARSEEGNTLLYYAVRKSLMVLPYLVHKGAGSTSSRKLGLAIVDYVQMFLTYFIFGSNVEVMKNLCHIAKVCPRVQGLTDFEKVADIIISHVYKDVNCRNENGTTLLHIAATFGLTLLANFLIHNGADVNIKDRQGRTPIHAAVHGRYHCVGFESTVLYLLKRGAIYDEKDGNGRTVFDYFSQSRTDEDAVVSEQFYRIDNFFKNLVKNFKDIEIPFPPFMSFKISYSARNSSGNTLLHVFAEIGKAEIVEMFIKHGCPFNSRNNENYTPKDMAHMNNHQNVVHLLQSVANAFTAIKPDEKSNIVTIRYEEFINARDENGRTILHWAAANGNVCIAAVLLKNGADIDKNDCSGWKPLHFAAKHDKPEIIKLLLYHGAHLNPKNRDRKSPLQVATGKSLNLLEQVNEMFNAIKVKSPQTAIKCLKSMQSHDYHAFVAAINCADSYIYLQWPFFNYVVAANDLELALFLLQNGAPYDTDYMGKCGKEMSIMLRFIDQLFKWETQLIYSHNAIQNCPIKLKVICNCRDKHGNTILHKAAKYPINYDRLKLLIKHGADVNAINKKGETVLDKAIWEDNLDLVEFLKNNANVEKLVPGNKQKLTWDYYQRPDNVVLFHSLRENPVDAAFYRVINLVLSLFDGRVLWCMFGIIFLYFVKYLFSEVGN